jgi:two-component system response regulator DctR
MNPTVFVVDDEPDVRNAVAFALRQSGRTVRTFADGRELLSAVDALLPDLRAIFVLDVRMEPLSGPALHDALIARGLRERTPVLFLSGQGDIPLVVAAMSKGALDFVEKPHIDRLVAKMTAAVAKEAEWFEPLDVRRSGSRCGKACRRGKDVWRCAWTMASSTR